MSALDQLLDLLPLAAKKALAARESNVALHPATVPAVVRHGVLAHKDDAGPPGGGTPPVRVVAVLGPGATFRGLAETLLPVYAKAGVAKPLDREDLAKGLVFYNRAFLPAGDWRHHKVGLCLPLPIEIDAAGAWTVNADDVRAWAASGSFRPEWAKRLSTPPAPLDLPEPAQIEGDAAAVLAAAGTPASRAAALWAGVLRNPYEAVLTFFAILRQLAPAAAGMPFALAALDGAQAHQLALLAATRAGNGILRRLARELSGVPPPGTDAAKLAAARTLVDNALHQGPAGARTLVPHREVPETVDLLVARPGSAKAVPGAKADPGGGLHRMVLGREATVGHSETARVAGVNHTGPQFAGRLLLDPFLDDDAKSLNPPPGDPRTAGLLVLLAAGGAAGRLDAVKARDPGLLTVGLGAWSALTPDSKLAPTGLAALLFRFKSISAVEFDLFFALHGLDVDRDPADPTRFRLRSIGADGSSTIMDAAALQTFLGATVDAKGAVTISPEWAARFRLPALLSRRYRRAQVLLAIEQLTPNPVELAVASVNPFPTEYRLDVDIGVLNTAVNADATAFLASLPAGLKSKDTLAGAVIDLTAAAPAKPAYAGFNDEETFYVGSMAKTAALYAAFELRFRLRTARDAAKVAGLALAHANWHLRFLAAVRKTWSGRVAKGFPRLDTHMPARLPDFKQMFTFSPGGAIEFTKGTATIPQIVALNLDPPTPNMKFSELMTSMILMSNAFAAGQVIDAVGYPYLNGVLREGGFFHPASERGIWVSGDYVGRDWRKPDVMALSPRGKRHYKATTNFVGNAKQFAQLLALAAQHELFDKDGPSCDEMIKIMTKFGLPPDADTSFIRDAIEDSHIPVDKVFSKIGIGDRAPGSPLSGIHDCAIIERKKGATRLRYVAVFVGGYSDFHLTLDPETGAYFGFVQLLDGAVAKVHP